jgi:hypothetical protein
VKPKENKAGNISKSYTFDRCQTPFYALDPLLPYLAKNWLIWESAAGNGQIVSKLQLSGFDVVSSDLLTSQNFFSYSPSTWDCQVTNPPYSTKYQWLARSYQLGKPFALLLPLETLGAQQGQKLFERYGVEIILLNKRVNFNMPNLGYSGNGAQFPTAWFTFGLKIGRSLTFAKIERYDDGMTFYQPQLPARLEAGTGASQ